MQEDAAGQADRERVEQRELFRIIEALRKDFLHNPGAAEENFQWVLPRLLGEHRVREMTERKGRI